MKNKINKIRIMIIFGTRPEAIKMAPIIKKLKSNPRFDIRICSTGQHREMLGSVLHLFELSPDYELNIMAHGQNLSQLTSKALLGLDQILTESPVDLIMVHGDTSTAVSASISSYYHHIPVAHVEAGLRTGDIYAPWPEEMNRKLIGCISSLHFAPTELTMNNLINEDVSRNRIFVTGNSVIDALFYVLNKIECNQDIKRDLDSKFAFLNNKKKLILVTGHRRESFGSGFENICKALLQISYRDDVEIVYPVHLNPNVKEPVTRFLSNKSNIFLTDPLDYLPFIYLMNRSYLILTDSGGVQEEAPSLGKPVLVMREKTERQEAVDAGTVKLVGTAQTNIINAVNELLDNSVCYDAMTEIDNPYGDGHAAEKIEKILIDQYPYNLNKGVVIEKL
jgi:UDP-N-acetylglucosamine 2-epimerase (non-hydrolysing)